MKVYIDSEYRCHVANTDNQYVEVETNFFDNKCIEFIEGYRFIPSGKKWLRPDGTVFHGEMIAPWKDYTRLSAAQHEYEQQRLLEYETKEIELNNLYNEGVNSI